MSVFMVNTLYRVYVMNLPFPFERLWSTNDLTDIFFAAGVIDSVWANGKGSLTIKSLTQG